MTAHTETYPLLRRHPWAMTGVFSLGSTVLLLLSWWAGVNDWVKVYLGHIGVSPPPMVEGIETVPISYPELAQRLWMRMPYAEAAMWWDEEYHLPQTLQMVQDLAEWDWADSHAYKRNTMDCDKYARLFALNAAVYYEVSIGVVIVSRGPTATHALNFTMLPDGTVLFIEAQTDTVWVATQSDLLSAVRYLI